MKKLKVLITCGATWAPIDDVRVISNVSSGEMGHLIARAFRQKHAAITIIEGPVTHALTPAYPRLPARQGRGRDKKIKIIKYRFFDELARVLKRELSKKYDIIVHAAAVSDFKVSAKGVSQRQIRLRRRSAKIFGGKVPSDRSLNMKLIPTPKLIDMIKRLSPESFLVGFKLESNLNPRNIFKTVKSLFTLSGCDLVVANTLKGGYRGFIVNENGDILSRASDKRTLAQNLMKLFLPLFFIKRG